VKAFLTGATGFVGSAVARSLLRRGIEVRVLARRGSNLANLSGLDMEVAYGDLLDRESLTEVLRGCDTLFHVAALYSATDADRERMYEVNVRGTKNILQAAQDTGVSRIVHTSTIGTIGQPQDGSLATEETPLLAWGTSHRPAVRADLSASHYAKSKYLAEVAALTACERGLPVVVVNPCAPVGARDIKPSSTGQRIVDYLRGRMPSFIEGGINFVAVDDVAEGHLLAAAKGRVGQRYILGNREGNWMRTQFLAVMARVSGQEPPRTARRWGLKLDLGRVLGARPRQAPTQDLRPRALTCDPSKAIHELGLPQTPLEVAFAEAVQWFRENGYV
jgi:dihydroflavonol-4-reductase